jgi:hypothetical protein
VCLYIISLPTSECLIQSLCNLYVYHGTEAHLSNVLHKSLPLICVCMYNPPIVSRQRLDKHVPAATNKGKVVPLLN